MKRTLPADIHVVGAGFAGGRNKWCDVTGHRQPLSSGIVSVVVDKGKKKIM
jgi:hypothetical protein